MEKTLWIKESFVNETEGCQFGDSDWYETFTGNIKQLFISLQKEYGRCTSKMYIDPDAKQVGWVFEKEMQYEDCKKYYKRVVWVEVSKTEPVKHCETLNVNYPF